MDNLVVDHERQIYLDRHAGFTASYDFATVTATANALAGRLGVPSLAIGSSEVGSTEAYEKYLSLVRMASAQFRHGDVWYDPRTPAQLRHALETARATRRQVRLFYGDPRTGLDRLATRDVLGYVGYAAWSLPHPILLSERQTFVGPRIVELEIVKVIDVDSFLTTYSHSSYHMPTLTIVAGDEDGVGAVIAADGHRQMACTTHAQATRWCKFFRGQIHQPPRQQS